MGINSIVGAILWLALLGHQPGTQARSANPLAEGEALLEKQNYDQAETAFKALITSQAKNPQLWFDLGYSESHLGKEAEAIAAYQKAVELSPTWFEANLNLGLALAKAGKLPESIPVLQKTVSLKPTNDAQHSLGRAWLSLAQALESSDPKEALNAYRKASELTPENSDIYLAQGILLERGGDPAAEQQYIKAASAGNAPAVERLIALYLKEKRLADAESWLQKYLDRNPGNAMAQIQLGRVLVAEGKTPEAIAALEKVNGSSPSPQVGRALAGLYLEAKQYDPAAKLFQSLSAANPTDADLHLGLGNALLYQRKYPEAEAELLKALQQKRDLPEGYGYLAEAAHQNQHHELAIRALDARAHFLPETPATYFLRAISYDSLRAYKQAAENYKLFLAASAGKSPDQEFQARHRLKAIEH